MSQKLKEEPWSGLHSISPLQEEARKKGFELFCHFCLPTDLSACKGPTLNLRTCGTESPSKNN